MKYPGVLRVRVLVHSTMALFSLLLMSLAPCMHPTPPLLPQRLILLLLLCVVLFQKLAPQALLLTHTWSVVPRMACIRVSRAKATCPGVGLVHLVPNDSQQPVDTLLPCCCRLLKNSLRTVAAKLIWWVRTVLVFDTPSSCWDVGPMTCAASHCTVLVWKL